LGFRQGGYRGTETDYHLHPRFRKPNPAKAKEAAAKPKVLGSGTSFTVTASVAFPAEWKGSAVCVPGVVKAMSGKK